MKFILYKAQLQLSNRQQESLYIKALHVQSRKTNVYIILYVT